MTPISISNAQFSDKQLSEISISDNKSENTVYSGFIWNKNKFNKDLVQRVQNAALGFFVLLATSLTISVSSALSGKYIIIFASVISIGFCIIQMIHGLQQAMDFLKLRQIESQYTQFQNALPKEEINSIAQRAYLANNSFVSFEQKLKFVSKARYSVEISFNFAGGTHFQKLLMILEDKHKANPNFTTHLLISDDLLKQKDIKALERLKKSFKGQFFYVVTNRVPEVTKLRTIENHVKLMVVDGFYYATGGSGVQLHLNKQSSAPGEEVESKKLGVFNDTTRDCDIFACGSLGNKVRKEFFKLYWIWLFRMMQVPEENEGKLSTIPERIELDPSAFIKEYKSHEGVNIEVITTGPENAKDNAITLKIIEMINDAKKTIDIGNLYFNPDKRILKALASAKKRGVNITGIFNGYGWDKHMMHIHFAIVNHQNYKYLTKAYERTVFNQLYHKKVLVIDSNKSLITSYNLGQKSAFCDYESAIYSDDIRIASDVIRGLSKDIVDSELVFDSDSGIDMRPVLIKNFGFVFNRTLGKVFF